MIKFDPALLSIDIVQLKSVTTALGGSISILDDARSTDKKEVYKRIVVPMAVTQSFIKKTHKITKYLKPVYTALVKYDNSVIAMERHPLSSLGELEFEGVFGPTRWVPDCEASIEQIIKPLINHSNKQWYFDGRYIYSFDGQDLNDVVRNSEHLTHDGCFRKVVAHSIDVQDLSNKTNIRAVDRSCLAFVTSQGTGVISPPIWKNISDVGSTQLKKAFSGEDEEDDSGVADVKNSYSFDRIDETLSVNLNFALKAGHDIGKMFGYEHVEPLRLPQLMIELCTVNLPNIPVSVKATYDIGLKFTHTISWLLGLINKTQTLSDYIVMRSLLKHLTKKGIFRNNVFDAAHIFKTDCTVENVPLKSLDDLIKDQDFTKQSLSAILMQARMGNVARSRDNGVHSIDTLMNDE